MTGAIKVEGLWKEYAIGAAPHARLHDVLSAFVASPLRALRLRRPVEERFWALRDVSFEVNPGEVLGVIGRNGAGKSTLLKVLSRITEPTRGRATVRGRMSSLLEVGTGFHPDLTGRENIHLNGAILGMRGEEIRRKFDEIVSFAEVERFLDTPVKRYSSGMYVRLAFAVAAHLEPDILLVDEVLAVGDAQFQKKCLGKMEEVGRTGRTVMFVSHNMAMISSLCQKALHLESGRIAAIGDCADVILRYATSGGDTPARLDLRETGRKAGDESAQLLAADILGENGELVQEVAIGETFCVRMRYRIVAGNGRTFIPNFHFHRADGSCAFISSPAGNTRGTPGEYVALCRIPGNFMNDGMYSVELALTSYEPGVIVHFDERGALTFNVRDPIEAVSTRPAGYSGPIPGAVRPLLEWTIEAAD